METINTSSEENTLTLGMVTGVVKLSKLQIRNIFSAIGQTAPETYTPLTPRALQHILLADLLENIKFLKSEQRAAILSGVWATKSSEAGAESCCDAHQIFFADSQYATWIGYTGWLDLQTGDTVDLLPYPPLETIAYNLVELERQMRSAIDNRSGSNAKRSAESIAGSMEEQGYVRVGPLDAVSGQVRDGSPDMGPDDHHAGN